MKKITIFGKPGSGKSTLSKVLAKETGIELYPLDSLVYQANGALADRNEFEAAHNKILGTDRWIMDGFGPLGAFNKRLELADTLIYIDLPYFTSYWFVTKRLLKGLFVKPEGWPDGSSVIKGSLQSYKVLRLCPRFWNDEFMKGLEEVAGDKSLFVIRSLSDLNLFIENNVKN